MKFQACQRQAASTPTGSPWKAELCPRLGTADHLGGFNTLACLRGLVLSVRYDQLEGTVAPRISGKVFRFASLQADKHNELKEEEKKSEKIS